MRSGLRNSLVLIGLALGWPLACFRPHPYQGPEGSADGGAGGQPDPTGSGGAAGSGSSCEPGGVCYTGPEGTQDSGLCRAGVWTCDAEGQLACEGQVQPVVEDCSSTRIDENCDGSMECSGQGVFTLDLDLGPRAQGLYVAIDGQGRPIVVASRGWLPDDNPPQTLEVVLVRASRDGQVEQKRTLGSMMTEVTPAGLAVAPDGTPVVLGWVRGMLTFDNGKEVVGDPGALFVARWTADARLDLVSSFQVNRLPEMVREAMARRRLAVDGEGNLYVTTDFTGESDIDGVGPAPPLSASGVTDVLVAKFDPQGTLQWARALNTTGGGSALPGGIAVHPETQDVIVASSFHGIIDPDGPGNNPPINSIGDENILLRRLSGATGEQIWAKRFGDGDSIRVSGLAIDPSGDVVLSGWFRGKLCLGAEQVFDSGNNRDIFVAKLRGIGGEHRWSKRSANDAPDPQEARSIAVDSAGHVLVTGYSTGNLGELATDCGLADLPEPNGEDVFVVKLSPEGKCIWARRPQFSESQVGFGIAADPLGSVFVTGRFIDSFGFSAMDEVQSATEDAFLARLAP